VTHAGKSALGQIVRRRRRELNLTQSEVARRIRTTAPFMGDLERGRRLPSDRILIRLAKVLDLDARELLFLRSPHLRAILRQEQNNQDSSAWEQFSNDDRVRRLYSVTNAEMGLLSSVALLGEVRTPHEFIYILNAVRHAIAH
jgi:transcriptional regulator with XRE-family HTH domain